eukprot:3513989-Prymnesium_polylepis.1
MVPAVRDALTDTVWSSETDPVCTVLECRPEEPAPTTVLRRGRGSGTPQGRSCRGAGRAAYRARLPTVVCRVRLCCITLTATGVRVTSRPDRTGPAAPRPAAAHKSFVVRSRTISLIKGGGRNSNTARSHPWLESSPHGAG